MWDWYALYDNKTERFVGCECPECHERFAVEYPPEECPACGYIREH